MATIAVTFPKEPKNEMRLRPAIEHFRANLGGVDYFVFKIGKSIPKSAAEGDKCYVGFDNKIQGYFIFYQARLVKEAEAKDFENWDESAGNFIFCYFDSFKELPEPKPIYERGWTGFRYWNDVLREGWVQAP